MITLCGHLSVSRTDDDPYLPRQCDLLLLAVAVAVVVVVCVVVCVVVVLWCVRPKRPRV